MDEHTAFNSILITGYSAVLIIGLFGNGLSCFIFNFRRRHEERNNFEILIRYLAIVDLIASISYPILYIYWHSTDQRAWHFGEELCKLIPTINVISVNISIGIILIITIDRCRSICQPFKRPFSQNVIRVATIVTIVLSCLVEIPYITQLTEIPRAKMTVKCVHNATDTGSIPISDVNNRESLLNNTSSGFLIYKVFTAYSTCPVSVPESIDLMSYYTSIKINITSFDIASCISQCDPLLPTCAPITNTIYNYLELTFVLFRDAAFIILFGFSIKFIYRELHSKGSLPAIEQEKILKMLTWMAIVFSVLVFPAFSRRAVILPAVTMCGQKGKYNRE